jgi:hypothetical protein
MGHRNGHPGHWRDKASAARQRSADLPEGPLRDALARIADRYEQIAECAEWSALHGDELITTQRALVKEAT